MAWQDQAVAVEEPVATMEAPAVEETPSWQKNAEPVEEDPEVQIANTLHQASLKEAYKRAYPEHIYANKHQKRTPEEYADYAKSVAQSVGAESTPEFEAKTKGILDAFDLAGSDQVLNTPKEQRQDVLNARSFRQQEVDRVRKETSGAAAQWLGSAIGGGMSDVANIAQSLKRPFINKEQWDFEDALNKITSGSELFKEDKSNVFTRSIGATLSRGAKQAVRALPTMGVAAAAGGPAGIAMAFGAPTVSNVYDEAKAKGATDTSALVAGSVAGIVDTLLFAGPVSKIIHSLGRRPVEDTLKAAIRQYGIDTIKTGGVLSIAGLKSKLASEVAAQYSGGKDIEGYGPILWEAIKKLPDEALQGALLHTPQLIGMAAGKDKRTPRSQSFKSRQESIQADQKAFPEKPEEQVPVEPEDMFLPLRKPSPGEEGGTAGAAVVDPNKGPPKPQESAPGAEVKEWEPDPLPKEWEAEAPPPEVSPAEEAPKAVEPAPGEVAPKVDEQAPAEAPKAADPVVDPRVAWNARLQELRAERHIDEEKAKTVSVKRGGKASHKEMIAQLEKQAREATIAELGEEPPEPPPPPKRDLVGEAAAAYIANPSKTIFDHVKDISGLPAGKARSQMVRDVQLRAASKKPTELTGVERSRKAASEEQARLRKLPPAVKTAAETHNLHLPTFAQYAEDALRARQEHQGEKNAAVRGAREIAMMKPKDLSKLRNANKDTSNTKRADEVFDQIVKEYPEIFGAPGDTHQQATDFLNDVMIKELTIGSDEIVKEALTNYLHDQPEIERYLREKELGRKALLMDESGTVVLPKEMIDWLENQADKAIAHGVRSFKVFDAAMRKALGEVRYGSTQDRVAMVWDYRAASNKDLERAPGGEPVKPPEPQTTVPKPNTPAGAPPDAPSVTPSQRAPVGDYTGPPGSESGKLAYTVPARGGKQAGVEELTDVDAWERALAVPTKEIQSLFEELRANPRPVSKQEEAILLRGQIILSDRVEKFKRDIKDAGESGDPQASIAAKKGLTEARLKRDQMMEIEQITGSIAGQALQGKKLMIGDGMEVVQELKEAKEAKGEDLTEEEVTEIEDRVAKYKELEAKYKELQAKVLDSQREEHVQDSVDKTVAEVKADAVKPKSPEMKLADDKIAEKKQTFLEKWRAKLRMGAIYSSAEEFRKDNELMAATMELVKAYVDKGRLTLSEVWEHVRKDLGDSSDQLKQVIGYAWDGLKAAAQIPERKIDPEEAKDLKREALRIQRSLVESGIKDRNVIVDTIHKELKDLFTDLTPRGVMEVLSDYGKTTTASKDDTDIIIRDVRAQLQKWLQLEDWIKKGFALATGKIRDKPTKEQRDLQKEIEIAKKEVAKFFPETMKGEDYLKASIDEAKTAVKNRIEDLSEAIRLKKRIVQNVTRLIPDDELLRLRKERDDWQQKYDFAFPKKPLTEEQQIQRAMAVLDRIARGLQKDIDTKNLGPKPKKGTPASAELDAKRAEIVALRARIEDLRKNDTQYQHDLEERRNSAYTTMLKERLAKLEKKNLNPATDWTPKARKERKLDPEQRKLTAEMNDQKLEAERNKLKWRKKNQTGLQNFSDWVSLGRRAEIFSTPVSTAKVIMASLWRAGTVPLEEVAKWASKKIPGKISRTLHEGAPLEGGGGNYEALMAAGKAWWHDGMRNAWQQLKEHESDLERQYGGTPKHLPPQSRMEWWLGLPQSTHAAAKAPVKAAGFAYAREVISKYHADRGVDVNEPLMRQEIDKEAYAVGKRWIFDNDNIFAKWFNGLDVIERNPATGEQSMRGSAIRLVKSVLVPVVKIPTNVVAEVIDYAFGVPIGGVKLGIHIARGLEKATPEQMDGILRSFHKGAVGAAFVGIGFALPGTFGGFYERGEKKKDDEPGWGEIRIPGIGYNIPKWFIHNPLLECLQIGATLRTVYNQNKTKSSDEKRGAFQAVVAAVGGAMEQVPMISASERTLQLLKAKEASKAWNELIASIMIPGGIQWAAQQMDRDERWNKIKRYPQTFVEDIKSKIPGLRKSTPNLPKKDLKKSTHVSAF